MKWVQTIHSRILLGLFALVIFAGCSTQSGQGEFYGKTVAPDENVLRYISGSQPESLDPQVPTGQPEARVLMSLYEGLVEYDPKTMDPIPALAESWEIKAGGTEYVFHLRRNAKFSNGDPITAKDLVYTFRRGLAPELAAKNAYLSYYIKYAEAFNSGKMFVKKSDGTFLRKRDFEDGAVVEEPVTDDSAPMSDFHRFLDEPERLALPGTDAERAALSEKDPKLKTAVTGAEFVPITVEDIGVEAVDDYTFRIKLLQPAPFFLGLLGHQFFRVVHEPTIDKFGRRWTQPENIVTSGPFTVGAYRPYDQLDVVKDPNYWDAEMVKLDRIEFYPMEEATTMMNLYIAGEVDAMYNHTVPAAWNSRVREFKDEYLNAPEVAIEYYTVNVKRPPMNNVKLRQAFALAIDREALAKFRKTTTPLLDFTPEGIFPKYEEARKKVYERELAEMGSSMEEWKSRVFDPEKARALLAEVGYPVQKTGSGYACPTFPISEVDLTYNTAESNKAVAEFIQAQWRQNLGITVPLKNMEWNTFLNVRKQLEYNGMARAGWVGDYMDPFSFLYLFYSENNDSSTGWSHPDYDKLLDDANKELDEMKRFEKLAEAEFMMMKEAPVLQLQTQRTNWIKKPYVKGMYPNPGTLHPWKFIYIERDPAKWDRDVDNIMSLVDPWVQQELDRLNATQEAAEANAKAAASNDTKVN